MSKKRIIAVIGAGSADEKTMGSAERVGRLIAERGALLLCGGLGGVMEAASRGAKAAGGTTIGILPGSAKEEANPFIDVPIPTGFGEGRNVFIVRTADALIALAGEYGTLSEIALALKSGKPVIGLETWGINGVIKAHDEHDAVEKTFAHLGS
jgi:uncharacterized protein (TIGR00725 family)